MNLVTRVFKKIFGENKIIKNRAILNEWKKNGKPVPPPHLIKQLTILAINKKYRFNILVETGTYLGEMIIAQRKNFKKIYSIELSDQLYADAVKTFELYKNVTILHGDSGDVLIDLLPQINESAIFWLDGHYSGGYTAKGKMLCPIYAELTAIFNAQPLNHILLIDDARLFIGQDDYPTITDLTAFIKKHRPHANVYIVDDIIHAFIKN